MSDGSIREGLALLRDGNFARLFFAHLVTFTGSAMAPIAMAFGVLELTGSTRDAAIVIAAPIVAQIAIILFGGVLADRTSRQFMMVGADSLAAASQAVMATLFLTGLATVPLLTGLMLINGTAMALVSPASHGFIPQVVPESRLQAANALLGMARNSATTAGAALAGLLVAMFGAGITIAIDAASFALSALLVLGIRPQAQTKTESASLIEDLRLGWQEFIRHGWLWPMVLQFTLILAAFEATFGLLGPAIAREQLGGAFSWGLISASMGAGTLLGGLYAMRLRAERPMLVGACTCFLFCAPALALSGPLPLPWIMLTAVIAGCGGQVFFVLWMTTMQMEIRRDMLSRVTAYDYLGSLALAPLGMVAGGFLFEAIGARPTMLIAVAAVVAPTMLVLTVPAVWQLRRRPPAEETGQSAAT